jgi:hypothetical protein
MKLSLRLTDKETEQIKKVLKFVCRFLKKHPLNKILKKLI